MWQYYRQNYSDSKSIGMDYIFAREDAVSEEKAEKEDSPKKTTPIVHIFLVRDS
jgi:hypothetical protein